MLKRRYILLFLFSLQLLISCDEKTSGINFGPSRIVKPKDSNIVNVFPLRFEWEVYDKSISQVSTLRLFEAGENGQKGKIVLTKEIDRQSYFVLDTFKYGKTYHWDIVSRNQEGLVFNSPLSVFRTSNYRPRSVLINQPTDKQVIEPNQDYLNNGYTIKWTDKEKSNQKVLYELLIIKQHSFYDPGADTTRVVLDNTSYRYDKFKFGIPYTVLVKSRNQIDPLRFAFSLPVNFRIKDTIGDFNIQSPANNTLLYSKKVVEAKWNIPPATNPKKTRYNVYVQTFDPKGKVLLKDTLKAINTTAVSLSKFIRFSGRTVWHVRAYDEEEPHVYKETSKYSLSMISREYYEVDIINQIYKEMNGTSWDSKCSNWGTRFTNPSSFYGVSYNSVDGVITDIDLSSCGIKGGLSGKFVELEGLVSLNISQNHGLCKLPETMPGSLRRFSMISNNCSGGLPLEVGTYAGLEYLSLYANKYSGFVPPAFGTLKRLKQLDLRSNSGLTGYMDAFVCDNEKNNGLRVLISGTNLVSCSDRDK